MSTLAWHAGDDMLEAYVNGGLHAVEAASVEQHLTRCSQCRIALRTHADSAALEGAWRRVLETVERPAPPLAIRVARRVGVTEPASVLLAATASLRTAWLSSAAVALGFALLASRFTDGDTLWPFLLVAPLVPVLGVASAYAPAEDSLETLAVVAPYGRTRLVLVRTIAVLVLCLPFAILLGLFLPGPRWVAAAWLGPALALVPVLLAIAAWVGPRIASVVVGLGWSAAVLWSARYRAPTWPVEGDQQRLLLLLAAAAVLMLLLRGRTTRVIGEAL